MPEFDLRGMKVAKYNYDKTQKKISYDTDVYKRQIKDSVELDKREVASLVGVTPYMVGVGSYSDAEHNHMIRTTAVTISNIICQELTRKLLILSLIHISRLIMCTSWRVCTEIIASITTS